MTKAKKGNTPKGAKMGQVKTLAMALPEEQERVRGVLKIYEEIGLPGEFAAMMIKALLKDAEIAASAQDVVAMLRAYEDLKEIKD